MILGIDEVGRGPWAGPLVVGAVVLGGASIEGLTDSKKLSKRRREEICIEIHEKAAGFGLGWVEANELDEIGMSAALALATRRAVEQITVPYHEIIIDGTVNFLAGTPKGPYVSVMPKADLLIPSVSAASIIAKVARDTFMAEQGKLYPHYGFARNAGYGVLAHRNAIQKYGVTPLHRLSFKPLQKYSNFPEVEHAEKLQNKPPQKMSTGKAAELVAAEELKARGYQIVERNWRTKWCEIDIIAKKEEVIYFVEVKHRHTNAAGTGTDAITPKKLKQMKFAATLYLANKPDQDARLMVISSHGEPPIIQESLEII